MQTQYPFTTRKPTKQTSVGDVCSLRHAAAAVEMAVLLPVLMTIVLGAVDFGRYAYTYIAVTNGARAGAAYASMNPYSATTQAVWLTTLTQAVRDEMSQFDPNLIQVVATRTFDGNTFWRVRVDVTYPFETIVSWPTLLGYPQTMNLQKSVEIRGIR